MTDTALAAQPVLFSLPEPIAEKLAVEGRYTAERLLRDRPDTYRAICALLSEGQSVRAIKRVCNVHHDTIAVVATREKIAIDTGKERVVETLGMVMRMLSETLLDDVMNDRLKPEHKAIALAIVIDKRELLTGGATIRVGTEAGEPVKTWADWWSGLEKRVAGREITGLAGEENGQKAAVVHRLGGKGDAESPDAQSKSADATVAATDASAGLEPAIKGGGGAPFSGGGAEAPTS